MRDTIVTPAPLHRPGGRWADMERLRAGALDRSNPTHPAGTDPDNLDPLLALEPRRRGRHGNTTDGGTFRWPLA